MELKLVEDSPDKRMSSYFIVKQQGGQDVRLVVGLVKIIDNFF